MAFNPAGNSGDFQEMAKIATQEFWNYYKGLETETFKPDKGGMQVSVQDGGVMVSAKIGPEIAMNIPELVSGGFAMAERRLFDISSSLIPDPEGWAGKHPDATFQDFAAMVERHEAEIERKAAGLPAGIEYRAWLSLKPDEFGNVDAKTGFAFDSPYLIEKDDEELMPFGKWCAAWLKRERR